MEALRALTADLVAARVLDHGDRSACAGDRGRSLLEFSDRSDRSGRKLNT